MAVTFAAASSSSPFLTSPPPPPPFVPSSSSHHRHTNHHLSFPLFPLRVPTIYTVNNNNTYAVATNPRKPRTLILASSNSDSDSSLGDEFLPNRPSRSADKKSFQKSVLSDLIQEIEPLDVSVIQKDVPLTTLDAMKRTISGMLGLLPSDRFQVFIESLWEPLSKLLVSSMMTGYTLWNAEYRLCLERNLDVHEGDLGKQSPEHSKLDLQEAQLDSTETNQFSQKDDEFVNSVQGLFANPGVPGLDEISPEVQEYILHLQSRLSSVKKELHEVKRKSAALQMQQFVGEEKNDLLDYLRSLEPEKVAELSEPTSPEVKETILSVVHGLLATLSPKMHSRAPPQSENTSSGTPNIGGEDYAELVENTSLQFQPLISLTRDYLARLLFWCMLLGHHIRGLEYRMELMELLSLTSDSQNVSNGDERVA